jgi:hypothetical protein
MADFQPYFFKILEMNIKSLFTGIIFHFRVLITLKISQKILYVIKSPMIIHTR